MKQPPNEELSIVSFGPTGRGTKVFTKDGTELHGVRSLRVAIDIDEPNRATVELVFLKVELSVVPTYVIADPVDGTFKKVKRIELEDGTVFPKASC